MKVLLIEDNPDDQFLAIRILRKNQIEDIIVCDEGEKALCYLLGKSDVQDRHETLLPTCIFLDIRLPKADGFEILEQLRNEERTRDIPVFVLSSSPSYIDVLKCRDLGVTAYLTKPLTSSDLVGALEQLNRFHLKVIEQRARVLRCGG